MTTKVLIQSASGREKIVTLFGKYRSDEAACRVACDPKLVGEGWRAVRVLP